MQNIWKKPSEGWNCRIIFSDIDGTLLDGQNQIPAETRKKILELEQRGIRFILLSARMPDGVRVVQRALGNHSPIVCYSGGLILDEQGNQIFSCQMPLEQAIEIKTAVKEACPGICCNTYGNEQWVVDDDQNPWVLQEEAITRGKAAVGDIAALFAGDGGVHKLLLMGEAEEIDIAAQMLREQYSGLTVLRSKDTYLEIMDSAVKKSLGVQVLCRYFGIPQEQAAAFGDGENDVDMLQSVRYGFAMANAPEMVRRAAPYVTLSNEDEGILHILRDL